LSVFPEQYQPGALSISLVIRPVSLFYNTTFRYASRCVSTFLCCLVSDPRRVSRETALWRCVALGRPSRGTLLASSRLRLGFRFKWRTRSIGGSGLSAPWPNPVAG